MFWLAGWTIGGVAVALSLAWMILGREALAIGPEGLSLRRAILGVGITRTYDLQQVKRLRVDPRSLDASRRRLAGLGWGLGDGLIAFDYGAQTVRCGASLDDAEARLILTRLTQRHPRLGAEGAA